MLRFRKADDQGNATAQFNLGVNYEQGRGVPQSDKEAAVVWQKAADQRTTKTQCNLGSMYDLGRGVPQSDKKAAV